MLLASFYINYKKVFELVLTGGNAKIQKIQQYTENTLNTTFLLKMLIQQNIANEIFFFFLIF